MGGLDQVGPAQVQELVVALDVLRPPAQPLAPVLVLGQPVGLQQRPHRPVDDEDPPLQLTHELRIPRAEILSHSKSVYQPWSETPKPTAVAGRPRVVRRHGRQALRAAWPRLACSAAARPEARVLVPKPRGLRLKLPLPRLARLVPGRVQAQPFVALSRCNLFRAPLDNFRMRLRSRAAVIIVEPVLTRAVAPRFAQSHGDSREKNVARCARRSSASEAGKRLPILSFMESKPTVAARLHAHSSLPARSPLSLSATSPTTSCCGDWTSSSASRAASRPTSSPTSARSTSADCSRARPSPRCSSTAPRRFTSRRPRPTAASRSHAPRARTPGCSRCSATGGSTSPGWRSSCRCSPRRTATRSSRGPRTGPSARSSSSSPSSGPGRTSRRGCGSCPTSAVDP